MLKKGTVLGAAFAGFLMLAGPAFATHTIPVPLSEGGHAVISITNQQGNPDSAPAGGSPEREESTSGASCMARFAFTYGQARRRVTCKTMDLPFEAP
jgi:hypothetical protein